MADDSRRRSPAVFTVDRLLVRILARRRPLILVPGCAAALMLILSVVPHRTYTSKVSFLPTDQTQTGSALAGLASQIGLNVGGASAGQSPDFYADLLVSDRLLSELALAPYRTVGPDGLAADTTLVERLVPGDGPPARRLAIAVIKLRSHLATETGANTGVVTLRASFKDPLLAAEVASHALSIVNRFNVESRQTQAAAQRRFLETQVVKTADDLKAAEDSLLRFLIQNRDYHNSPALSFQNDRLQRSVTMRQDAYTQVFQSFLQAQATEVQNTPVVTVVGPPRVPGLPDSRHVLLRMIAAALVAFVVLVTWFSLTDAMAGWTSESADLASVVADTKAEWAALRARGIAIATRPVLGPRKLR